ncbi:hypothetical protein NEOLEDRAFT_1174152 [Neolentinus lepideus HHB14362 ss-1]|uniref:PEHE domain-containing protein n=1 Tax=Neolentinus lepideus HHB14362 ss-1 TaxID=1314782 RepID=A0A165W799_9AGAM|nr:hypothetical protein NEOLEDRAFT_1174152 [Neolentinus lepideus HHB14362 ss-1]
MVRHGPVVFVLRVPVSREAAAWISYASMTMNNSISGKRAGKQRAQDMSHSTSTTDITANRPASVAKEGGTPNTRQKRVLPSRSRRGGPGIGNCDVDLMILDAHKRKFENEPLIPADTKFFLTTNSALIPSTSAVSFEIQLNSSAYERYFDRPEVIKAYREQQTIQTPEYTLLTEDASELTDTSDAAYEKRHRKYETFEKRQRLREKEKLKHEQYKLKERIDQLRAMDATAFLGLPASVLASPNDDVALKQADDETSSINGAAALTEGERRRKEMLDVAKTLEERYNMLLPPDRRWMEKGKNAARQKSISFSAEPEPEPEPTPDPVFEEEEEEEEEEEAKEEEEEEEEEDQEQAREVEEAEIPVAEEEERDDDGESEIDVEERRVAARKSPEKIKLKIKLRPSVDVQSASATRTKKLKSSSGIEGSPIRQGVSHLSFALNSDAGSSISAHLSNRRRSANGRFSPRKKAKVHDDNNGGSRKGEHRLSARSLEKAWSQSDVNDTGDGSMSVSKRLDRNVQCTLLATAKRNAGEPNVRKTQRHLTAFGLKVPYEVEEFRDFELPPWLLPGYETGEEEEQEVNGVSHGVKAMHIDLPSADDAHVDDSDIVMDSAPASEAVEVDVAFKGG